MKDKNQVLTVACKLLVTPDQAIVIDELYHGKINDEISAERRVA